MGELKQIYSKSNVVAQRVHHLLFVNQRMTQRQLALQLGIQPATISGKISGRTAWNLDELDVLADVFGVSTDYLLGREPLESASSVNAKIPAPVKAGISTDAKDVAEAGIDPATSRL